MWITVDIVVYGGGLGPALNSPPTNYPQFLGVTLCGVTCGFANNPQFLFWLLLTTIYKDLRVNGCELLDKSLNS